MTPTASSSTIFVTGRNEAPARTDISAATGILAGVAMSAVFWAVIGYALDAVLG